jgi:acetyl esterase/lipase
MPIGYLVAMTLVALCTFFAVVSPSRPWPLGAMSFRFGLAINELPFVGLCWIVGSTLLAAGQGDLSSSGGLVGIGLAAVAAAGLVVVAWRGLRAGRVIEDALSEGLGAGWRTAIEAEAAGRLRRGLPLARILLRPFFVSRRDVERLADIRYGDAGRRNLLDVYRRRSRPQGAPTLVYLHGGGYFSGRKDREGRSLLYRLASQGWVCVSANYRLLPDSRFPDHLVDAKKVIAWVREHGHEYGADPSVLFMSGSSAGGHMASMAALTPNDPVFQPGFEQADTSVTAVISLYGFYGYYYDHLMTEGQPPGSPLAYLRPDAPPFFMVHGDRDTVVPVEGAREFTQRLRGISSGPVVYAELPGAQHSFDLFHSLRFEAVVNGAEAFAAWVRSTRDRTPEDAQEA